LSLARALSLRSLRLCDGVIVGKEEEGQEDEVKEHKKHNPA